MSNKGLFFSLVLVSVLNCESWAPAVAADPGAGRLTLTDAMLKMMDAMGMIDQRSGADGATDFSRAWESMTQGARRMPWQGGLTPPTGTSREAPSNWWTDDSQQSMSLQGDWVSESGERLQIRGAQFRLRAGATGEVDGNLSLRGHLLALYSPRYNQTWIYEYAEHEGRLALRDSQGRLYLYRRIQPGIGGFSQERRPPPAPWAGTPRGPAYPGGGYMD
jgi:hypothetical protein